MKYEALLLSFFPALRYSLTRFSQISFVLKGNPRAAQKVDIGISIYGVVIQTFDQSATILHQYAIEEITYVSYETNEDRDRFSIIATRANDGAPPSSFLISLEENGTPVPELMSLIRQSLVAANCPFTDDGATAIRANGAVEAHELPQAPHEADVGLYYEPENAPEGSAAEGYVLNVQDLHIN
eukprot:m.209721 g.209721  ORF g.209721 m.209721 type:complete len:183 (+) comp10730_c0_seq1:65-613(+)